LLTSVKIVYKCALFNGSKNGTAIMGKKFIVLGDTTSHGGTVVSASGAGRMIIDGIPVACLGDMVSCPKKGCKGTFAIIEGSSGPDTELDGKPLAREGDKTACGAVLISAGQAIATHGPDSGGAGGAGAAPAPTAANSGGGEAAAKGIQTASAGGGITSEEARMLAEQNNDKVYKVQFKVVDTETGNPISNRFYSIELPQGTPISGSTDSDGKTDVIESDKPESVKIHVHFKSPKYEFTRDDTFTSAEMSDLKQSEFKTKANLVESTKAGAAQLMVFKISDRAATRQAIIASLRNAGKKVKTRSDWKAKPGIAGRSDGPDWDYDSIVIHHAGNSYTIKDDDMVQVEKIQTTDLKEFGHVSYHYMIGSGGTIFEGLDIREKGAHVDKGNTGKIGIVLLADFSAPSEAFEHEYSKKSLVNRFKALPDILRDNHDYFYDKEVPEVMAQSLSVLVDVLTIYFKVDKFGGHREFQPLANKEGRACPGDVGMKLVEKIRSSTGLAKP